MFLMSVCVRACVCIRVSVCISVWICFVIHLFRFNQHYYTTKTWTIFRIKEVVCFGEGAGANILARFAASLNIKLTLFLNYILLLLTLWGVDVHEVESGSSTWAMYLDTSTLNSLDFWQKSSLTCWMIVIIDLKTEPWTIKFYWDLKF